VNQIASRSKTRARAIGGLIPRLVLEKPAKGRENRVNTVSWSKARVAVLLLLPVVAITPIVATGQQDDPAKIVISGLDKLADKATRVVDVTLDGRMLQLAAKLLSTQKSPDAVEIRELLSGLRGVYVKYFEFDKEQEYSPTDVDPILAQLKNPSWSRMVGISSTKTGEKVEVYLMSTGDTINGLAVVAAEPRELTVVNIVGSIDVEKLAKLEGQYGIPKLNLIYDKPNKK
jgi:hypothetical protein